MDNKRDLLVASINKWKKIVKGTKELGIVDCACCIVYLDDNCENCPISERTGVGGCEGTPYVKWYDHFKMNPKIANTCEEIVLANNMLTFLEETLVWYDEKYPIQKK